MNPSRQPYAPGEGPDPPFDTFADVFNLELNPYGVIITYGRREPTDFVNKPVDQRPIKVTARIAITPAHLKHMVYLMWRQTVQFETAHGAINVPTALLEGVDMAEWNALYQVPPEPALVDKGTVSDEPDPVLTAAVRAALAEERAGKNENRPVEAEPAEAAASD